MHPHKCAQCGQFTSVLSLCEGKFVCLDCLPEAKREELQVVGPRREREPEPKSGNLEAVVASLRDQAKDAA